LVFDSIGCTAITSSVVGTSRTMSWRVQRPDRKLQQLQLLLQQRRRQHLLLLLPAKFQPYRLSTSLREWVHSVTSPRLPMGELGAKWGSVPEAQELKRRNRGPLPWNRKHQKSMTNMTDEQTNKQTNRQTNFPCTIVRLQQLLLLLR